MNGSTKSENPPVFAVGTGRCGTHFLHEVVKVNSGFEAEHLDSLGQFPSDSFIPYAVWNDLPVDFTPVRNHRQGLIDKAATEGKVYFESNPYLSLISDKLHHWYNARIILMVREPVAVVNSHYTKGWYQDLPERGDPEIPPCLPPEWDVHYFFGRLMPNGKEEYERWNNLTRVGKLAWWWNTLNLNVRKLLSEIPDNVWRIVKTEDFNHEAYEKLMHFMGGEPSLSRKKFNRLRGKKPGRGRKKHSLKSWSAQEWSEFLAETAEARQAFGYTEIDKVQSG